MAEIIQSAPLVALVLLALGLALGLVLGSFVLPSATRARKLQGEIDALRAEHARYQRRVTDHFQTTAVLVGDLTSSYKAVYEHLAAGARTLSDPALSAQGFGAPRLIVDGGVHERLPEEPIARDRTPAAGVRTAVERPEGSVPQPVGTPPRGEPAGASFQDEARPAPAAPPRSASAELQSASGGSQPTSPGGRPAGPGSQPAESRPVGSGPWPASAAPEAEGGRVPATAPSD